MSEKPDPNAAVTFEVASKDGAEIRSVRTGSGPPILLVSGGMMDGSDWGRVEPYLRREHTVYALDRRDRGTSGDRRPYTAQKEADDLFAVVEAIGGEVDLLAHSSGAVLVLMAMGQGLRLGHAVLYEPPIRTLFPAGPEEERHARVRKLVEEGNRHEALELFLGQGRGLPAEQMSGPRWQHQLDLIHTVTYDRLITAGFEFDKAVFSQIETPMMVIASEKSGQVFQDSARTVVETMPNARLWRFEGQGHIGMYTAPKELAAAVHAFVREH